MGISPPNPDRGRVGMRGFGNISGLAAAVTLCLWVGTVGCSSEEKSVDAAPPTDELQMGEIGIDEGAAEQGERQAP
jgi:hypothetical protein